MHELSVTVLNANQFPERTYMLVFTVRLRTDAGEIIVKFPAEFLYFRDPARRVLRLGARRRADASAPQAVLCSTANLPPGGTV